VCTRWSIPPTRAADQRYGFRNAGRRPDPDTGRYRRLSPNQKQVNAAHARQRGPGERANVQVKPWQVLRKIRSCTRGDCPGQGRDGADPDRLRSSWKERLISLWHIACSRVAARGARRRAAVTSSLSVSVARARSRDATPLTSEELVHHLRADVAPTRSTPQHSADPTRPLATAKTRRSLELATPWPHRCIRDTKPGDRASTPRIRGSRTFPRAARPEHAEARRAPLRLSSPSIEIVKRQTAVDRATCPTAAGTCRCSSRNFATVA
jgi:hypothetical protein